MDDRRRVTERETEALVAIEAEIAATGFPPTMAEIGRRLGVSRQRAHQLVVALEAHELIHTPRRGRHRQSIPTQRSGKLDGLAAAVAPRTASTPARSKTEAPASDRTPPSRPSKTTTTRADARAAAVLQAPHRAEPTELIRAQTPGFMIRPRQSTARAATLCLTLN